LYNPLHPPGTLDQNLPAESCRGEVDPVVAARAAEIQDTERQRVTAAREALAPVEKILGIDEFEVRHGLRLC
jgi:L-lactate dehydrogenase (cytochrome)